MASKNSGLSDWNKKGFALTEKGLVKSESLVASKVEKIDVSDIHITEMKKPFRNSEGQTYGESLVQALKQYSEKKHDPTYFHWEEPKMNIHLPETFLLPTGSYIDVLFTFDIIPCPAPRMTRRDAIFLNPEHKDPAKRQRACVTRYFAFKNEFVRQASINGFVLDEVLRVLFILPMPKTWSKSKRLRMNNQPHKQRPDADNMAKSIMDAAGIDDGYVWDIRAIKLWGETGQIIIF